MKIMSYIRLTAIEGFFIVSIFSSMLFGAFADQIQGHNNLTSTQLTILSGIFFITIAGSQLFAGYIINTISTRIFFVSSAMLSVVGEFVFAHTSIYPAYCINYDFGYYVTFSLSSCLDFCLFAEIK